MRRHLIIGRYGPNDLGQVALGEGEIAKSLQLVGNGGALGWGIGSAISDLAHIGLYPSEIGVDVLVMAAHVHAADTRISRSSESQDSWTREIRLAVPVLDPDVWNAAAPILVRLLNFLTGDRWTLVFRSRPQDFSTLVRRGPPCLASQAFDGLALFSGGLDSLIGAIDTLELGRNPLFISHAGEAATSGAQSTIFSALKEHYRGRALNRLRLWMRFPKGFISGSAKEDTTRSRSFLFFALGVFAGSGLGGSVKLRVPENGLISVNVPLDPLRLGALSTRTTHPFYIARWNEVLAILGLRVCIQNPYWDKTKGEMVSGCSNRALLRRLIPSALSCSSPVKGRFQGIGTQHCGYCVPCLIRRAALLTALRPDSDPTKYTVDDLKGRVLSASQSEGVEIRSFQFAIERVRARPELASILLHKPGPLSDEAPDRQAVLAEVYRRGLEEVGALLAGVRTQS